MKRSLRRGLQTFLSPIGIIMAEISPVYPEVFSFLQNRRSVPAKTMTGPGPGETEIEALIKIATRVPDHGKIAPWRFVRYTPNYCQELGTRILERFEELNETVTDEMRVLERSRLTRVPVVIAVISSPKDHPKVPVWEQQLSAGASAMTLLSAANALGYDAQWLTEWYAFDPKLEKDFGVQSGEKLAGFIHIGTKTMPKTERERPDISKVYCTMDKRD